MAERGDQLMRSLPAIYRAADQTGQLSALLAAFEAVLLASDDPKAPAIAQQIDAVPALFAPLGLDPARDAHLRTPDRFLPWLARWIAFEPYPHFCADRLRTILAGIVPLHGRRGTRQHLKALVRLCFDGVGAIRVDEHPVHGFTIGLARLGLDSWLVDDAPFRFRIEIVFREDSAEARHDRWPALEHRVRAIVDFAKPAHTAYDLVLTRGTANAKEAATP